MGFGKLLFKPINFKAISKIALLGLFFFIFHGKGLLAQDPLFSLYKNAPLYLNPALAGAEENPAFYSSHRSQWRNLGVPYTTCHFSLVAPIQAGKAFHRNQIGGYGISFFNDKAGENGLYKSVGLNASLAYNVFLSKDKEHRLYFGLQAGFKQRKIDLSSFKWGEQYNRFIGYDKDIDPSENLINGKMNLDINSGLYYTYTPNPRIVKAINKAFVGIAASHLNFPNQSLIQGSTFRTSPLFKFHGGVDWKIKDKMFCETQTLIMYQNGAQQYNIGSTFSYYLMNKDRNVLQNSFISFGTWYRVKDSFILSLETGSNFYKVGFSYDLNTSALGKYYKGTAAYEITFAAKLYKPQKNSRGKGMFR